MWGITQGWTPPFQYRIGYIPERDIVAAVSFKVEDEIGTEVMQRRAVAETLCIYNNDMYQLSKQKKDLSLAINDLVTAESWESALINCGNRFWIWKRQVPPIHRKAAAERLADTRPDYERFVQLLETEQQRELLGKALDNLYQPWLQNGVLEQLGHSEEEGRLDSIQISGEQPGVDVIVNVSMFGKARSFGCSPTHWENHSHY